MVSICPQQLFRIQIKPGLNTVLIDSHGGLFNQVGGVRVQLARFLVQKQSDWYTPIALSGDTPVRSTGDHAVNARLSPIGYPLYFFNLGQRVLAQAFGVHANEPLRRCPIDDGCLGAPAKRIAMLIFFMFDKLAAILQLFNDQFVYLHDMHAGEQLHMLAEDAVIIDIVQ